MNLNHVKSIESIVPVHAPFPLLTSEAFAIASGLPVGVVEAQMDRRILPVFRLGKRRMVNIEALREQARAAAAFPSKANS